MKFFLILLLLSSCSIRPFHGNSGQHRLHELSHELERHEDLTGQASCAAGDEVMPLKDKDMFSSPAAGRDEVKTLKRKEVKKELRFLKHYIKETPSLKKTKEEDPERTPPHEILYTIGKGMALIGFLIVVLSCSLLLSGASITNDSITFWLVGVVIGLLLLAASLPFFLLGLFLKVVL